METWENLSCFEIFNRFWAGNKLWKLNHGSPIFCTDSRLAFPAGSVWMLGWWWVECSECWCGGFSVGSEQKNVVFVKPESCCWQIDKVPCTGSGLFLFVFFPASRGSGGGQCCFSIFISILFQLVAHIANNIQNLKNYYLKHLCSIEIVSRLQLLEASR